eukprot:TRINITY_DN592_c0_g1_i1.p1 TRINITY_DN592_c0_g1~~TRINITY_DN592_c0_g1_i1.p1  ORF type:complete len:467 (+),score=142.49 TRINITY_DN592_c0_g1_i1:52-1401(+)
MSFCSRALCYALLACVLAAVCVEGGDVWFVSPFGESRAGGRSSDDPLDKISNALKHAKSGDEIFLMDGEHMVSENKLLFDGVALTGSGPYRSMVNFITRDGNGGPLEFTGRAKVANVSMWGGGGNTCLRLEGGEVNGVHFSRCGNSIYAQVIHPLAVHNVEATGSGTFIDIFATAHGSTPSTYGTTSYTSGTSYTSSSEDDDELVGLSVSDCHVKDASYVLRTRDVEYIDVRRVTAEGSSSLISWSGSSWLESFVVADTVLTDTRATAFIGECNPGTEPLVLQNVSVTRGVAIAAYDNQVFPIAVASPNCQYYVRDSVFAGTVGGPVFHLQSSNLTLERSLVTLHGEDVSSVRSRGGAIYAEGDCTVLVVDSEISRCAAYEGGALFCADSEPSVTFISSKVVSNKAEYGGDFECEVGQSCTIVLSDTLVKDNVSNSGYASQCSVIYPSK